MSSGAIPYARQHITEEDVEAVCAALRSDWLTQGPLGPRFETAVATKSGAAHAIATCNATAALHAACLALGLGPGDWVWTSPNTFVASANCARYCGARVDFVDIDERTYNMSPTALALKLADAERAGTLPKIVIPVHFAGQSCEMRAIHELGQRYGFRIIEDASHAVGGDYCTDPIGCGRYSDVVVLSFHPVKIITTGEGGMALTNDEDIANRIRLLRSHGVSRNRSDFAHAESGGWYYEQIALGFNYRLTDIQSALGLSQLTRLDAFIRRRREIAATYDSELRGSGVITPWQHPDTNSAYHLYPIQVVSATRDRRAVFDELRASNITVNVHYIPVHLQTEYRRLGFQRGDFPNAERYYERALSLPMFPALTPVDQERVVGTLRRLVG